MSKPIVFNTLGYEEAIDQSFMDEWEQAESEAEEQRLKWVRELIENRGREHARRPEQVSKQDRELALKQAMMNWDE